MKSVPAQLDRAVVLLSGGIDSTTLLHYVKGRLQVGEVHAISFAYGQKHVRELEMARRQARACGTAFHREVDLAWFADLVAGKSALTDPAIAVPDMTDIDSESSRQPTTYVPNRNMIFLSVAAAYAEARGITDVFYGAQAQDEYGYWDCTVDFVGRINHLLGLNRGQAITVHAPFASWSKAEVVRLGLEMGVDYEYTWTCYRGDAVPCGTCPSCVEKTRAFDKVRSERS